MLQIDTYRMRTVRRHYWLMQLFFYSSIYQNLSAVNSPSDEMKRFKTNDQKKGNDERRWDHTSYVNMQICYRKKKKVPNQTSCRLLLMVNPTMEHPLRGHSTNDFILHPDCTTFAVHIIFLFLLLLSSPRAENVKEQGGMKYESRKRRKK